MIAKPTLFAASVLLVSSSACAQDWTGFIDSDRNNPGNWSQWLLQGEDVTIDPATYAGAMMPPVVATNAVFVPNRVFVENSGQLTIAANTSVTDRMIIDGPSIVTKNAGSFSTDHLIISGGGRFEQSGATGTMVVWVALTLADGGTNGGSSFLMTAGNLVVVGDLEFDCELGEFDPEFSLTGGLAAVNGDVIWSGTAPGSGTPRMLIDGAQIDLNGTVGNTVASSVDMFLGIGIGTNMEASNALFTLAHPTDSIAITGGAFRLQLGSGIVNDGVLYDTGGDVYASGNNTLSGSGTYRFNNVNIDPGATLTHTAPSQIDVVDDWVDLGTFDPQQNTVAFTSDGLQLATGSGFHGHPLAHTGPACPFRARWK